MDTINIGILNFIETKPVNILISTHARIDARIATQIFNPLWYNNAQQTPANAYSLPTEKSRLPVSIKNDTPNAIRPVVATCLTIVNRLSTVKNVSGLIDAKMITINTNRICATLFFANSFVLTIHVSFISVTKPFPTICFPMPDPEASLYQIPILPFALPFYPLQ